MVEIAMTLLILFLIVHFFVNALILIFEASYNGVSFWRAIQLLLLGWIIVLRNNK